MKIALLSLCFVVSVTATAQARLGETADQLVARYGQPLSEVDQKGEGDRIPLVIATFQKNGIQIVASLSNGVSVSETFNKLNGEPFSVGEARTLLTSNSQGYDWSAPRTAGDQKTWARDDGSMAVLSGGKFLNLATKEFMLKQAIAKKLEQKPSLQGF